MRYLPWTNLEQLLNKEVSHMKKLDILAAVLVIVGGLNWGLVALGEFDLVAALVGLDFGETNALSRIVYGLVGLAAVYQIAQQAAIRRRWSTQPPSPPDTHLERSRQNMTRIVHHRPRRTRARRPGRHGGTRARGRRRPRSRPSPRQTPQFSTLLSLVKKAGLAGTLSKPGAYTVFAPTNAAFAKVPKATLERAGEEPRRAEARAPLPRRRRARCTAAKVVKLTLGEDARRPVGEDPRHRQDRPDQQRPR